MSKTPRTDLMAERAPIGLRTNAAFEQACNLCRDLERELNAANERIKRLEELGRELRECADQIGWTSSHEVKWLKRAGLAVKAWDKEAKP